MNYYNYFSEIEETFNRRRGKHLFLSPIDWAMIETWQAQGIPLHIVLRGIESVFDALDKKEGKRRQINSLMYCREEIEKINEKWIESQVGKHDGDGESTVPEETFSEEALKAHLQDAAESLGRAVKKADKPLAETIERVLLRLEELKANYKDAETLEAALTSSEELLNESLLQGENAKPLALQIESQLAAYQGKMDKDAYKQAYDLMLLKKLRESAGIPRLSLFYL